MVTNPEKHIEEFVRAGADIITIHVEATPHIHGALQQIRAAGVKAGVVINPGTPVQAIKHVLGLVDQVLVMTVNPGFGGQAFLPETLVKVSELASLREQEQLQFDIEVDGGIDNQTIKLAKEAGAIRFSIVTSGRNTSNPNEFNQILRVLKEIREKIGLEICCSLGLLTYEQALQLKEVGVTRYHSNIETAPSHFPDICSTHSYEDKMSTIENAKKAGIRVCSGGILGLNETLEQRVEMAFELKRLNIDSIPLNILNPIKGTPFEHNKALKPMEILRTFAVFRFILPHALIRTAGGREVNLRDLQSYALKGGLNGIMVGGYLTTGGRSPQDDLQMINDLELTRTAAQL